MTLTGDHCAVVHSAQQDAALTRGAPVFPFPLQSSRRLTSPFSPCGRRGQGNAYRGRFFGKPLHSFSHSELQNAQLPLLPLWEKGVGGMRGKSVPECRKSRISPKKSTLESRRNEGKQERWDMEKPYRTIPRAATRQMTSTSPRRTPTISSNRLLTTQQ